MGRVPDNSLKRKRPDGNLADADRALYELIRSRENMGIWTRHMKQELLRRELHLTDAAFNKALKSLQTKNLVKEVVNINNKSKKYYMASEFEPSKELTGGDWYSNGKLDEEFIKGLKEFCKKIIYSRKEATLPSISEAIKKSNVFTIECSTKQVTDILRSLVLENEITESKNILGAVCYRCVSKASGAKAGAMASIPCGACPRMNECTPDGVISPTTCVYYNKWLDF